MTPASSDDLPADGGPSRAIAPISEHSANVLATWPGTDPDSVTAQTLILNSHLDTEGELPPGQAEQQLRLRGTWREDDLLIGKGLVNAKAHLVAQLLPIMRAIRECRTACGELAWAAVEQIRQLRDTARAAGVPVFYTRARQVQDLDGLGQWAAKGSHAAEDAGPALFSGIVAELAPCKGDYVPEKSKSSAFSGTDQLSLLMLHQIGTLAVTGGAARGCVCATAVGAFSYNYPVAAVREAIFDRSELVQEINLFDMHVKYANLPSRSAAQAYLTRSAAAR